MKQGSALALAGLFFLGTVGCELNRPYGGRCLLAHHDYAESEGYRPKTVVTMRAETLPEAAPASEKTSTVQLASTSTVSTNSTSAGAAPANSTPVVTLTIPAMKIIIPMNAMTKAAVPVNATATVSQLPPINGAMASPNPMPLSPNPSASLPSDQEVHNAVHTEVEEAPSPLVATPVVNPDRLPDSKSAADAKTPKKKVNDALRPSKLSLLPPDPPEMPAKGSAGTGFEGAYDLPPEPPRIPRKSPEGPSFPPADPGSK